MLNRTNVEQAIENANQALRVLAMVPRLPSDLIPHPIDVVAAELRNVIMYLSREQKS